jgi:hypothetical protein
MAASRQPAGHESKHASTTTKAAKAERPAYLLFEGGNASLELLVHRFFTLCNITGRGERQTSSLMSAKASDRRASQGRRRTLVTLCDTAQDTIAKLLGDSVCRRVPHCKRFEERCHPLLNERARWQFCCWDLCFRRSL